MSRQSSSDPLPYVQVDRAVEPSSTLLAGHMKVTPQHALGSLVGFWKLCGDPRELERIVETTPAGIEPAVILTGEDVALRFQLASDHHVEPVILARLGILEPSGDRFRVRGMSRFFEPIEARLRARRVASKGGRASAASRLAATGTAQPRCEAGQPTPEPARTDSRTDVRTEAEPTPEAGPKLDRSLAVSGQRSQTTKETLSSTLDLGSFESPKPTPPADVAQQLTAKLTDDEFQVFEHWRQTLGHPKAVASPERRRLLAKWLPIYGVERLQTAISGCSRSPHHMGQNDRHTRYDSLELILRDAKNIESFEQLSANASRVA